jgi:hypothetical protein
MMSVFGGMLAQANFGKNRRSFEGIKVAPENRGARLKKEEKQHRK